MKTVFRSPELAQIRGGKVDRSFAYSQGGQCLVQSERVRDFGGCGLGQFRCIGSRHSSRSPRNPASTTLSSRRPLCFPSLSYLPMPCSSTSSEGFPSSSCPDCRNELSTYSQHNATPRACGFAKRFSRLAQMPIVCAWHEGKGSQRVVW